MGDDRAAWTRFHDKGVAQASYPQWPESSLVKVAFGKYLAQPIRLPTIARILDVGCGFGNNLLPYAEKGHSVAGVEVSDRIAETARGLLEGRGVKADIRVGHNRELPFGDDQFDLLLSVNALHYEGSGTKVRLALEEFRRVLRPGGRVLLMTVAPQHEIRESCESLGDGRYRIGGYDFRDGQIMFYVSSEEELARLLRSSFASVETGRVTEVLMTRTVDFFVASAVVHG